MKACRPPRAPTRRRLLSDAEPRGELAALVDRVAEEDGAGLRSLEVEVRRVLPGEAHAAVNLDGLGCRLEIRFGTVRLRHVRGGDELVAVPVRGAECRMVGGGE